MTIHDYLDSDWPPGTVKLQQLSQHEAEGNSSEIILQPRPTDDPNDPLNWHKHQKSINFFLASFYAMMVFAFISATSPTWGPLADELKFSTETLTNTYAMGSATLAMGAPMLIPFALKYGSRPVYVLSSIFQFAISIWAGKTQTAGDWWAVNALQCWFGALAEVLIQITIADMFFVHQRGLMNSIYVWAANIGSNLAVVAAGFITSNQGWRWVWWWCAILFGVQILMFVFGFEETKFTSKSPGTTENKEGGISQEGSIKTDKNGTDKQDENVEEKVHAGTSHEVPKKAPTENTQPGSDPSDLTSTHLNAKQKRYTYCQRLSLFRKSPGPWSQFFRHSWQPFFILASIPGILFCSLVYAILLAWANVMTTALSTYMINPPYNFTAKQIGLMNLAPFIGQTLGTLVVGPLSDLVALHLTKGNRGIYEPEMRFYVFVPFIPFQLAGAWWFGYSLAEGKSWAQVAVAFGVCNFGSAPLLSIALTYMLDAYHEIIGDALTALTFTRNLLSTIFVFAMPAWAAAVGVPNVFNTIGAIGILILSFSVFFIFRGKNLRVRTAKVYKYYAERQFATRPF